MSAGGAALRVLADLAIAVKSGNFCTSRSIEQKKRPPCASIFRTKVGSFNVRLTRRLSFTA
jgi:hypothetical protein